MRSFVILCRRGDDLLRRPQETQLGVARDHVPGKAGNIASQFRAFYPILIFSIAPIRKTVDEVCYNIETSYGGFSHVHASTTPMGPVVRLFLRKAARMETKPTRKN
jgi:hypothetical protein